MFDIGVGGKNFSFDAAKRVLDGGLIPDTISSDVTLQSRYVGTSFSLMDCIGKVISLGFSLEEALVMSTRNPAAVLGPETKQMLGCMAPRHPRRHHHPPHPRRRMGIHRRRWQHQLRPIRPRTRIMHPSRPSHAHRLRPQRRAVGCPTESNHEYPNNPRQHRRATSHKTRAPQHSLRGDAQPPRCHRRIDGLRRRCRPSTLHQARRRHRLRLRRQQSPTHGVPVRAPHRARLRHHRQHQPLPLQPSPIRRRIKRQDGPSSVTWSQST